jgi:hypothetical protein
LGERCAAIKGAFVRVEEEGVCVFEFRLIARFGFFDVFVVFLEI